MCGISLLLSSDRDSQLVLSWRLCGESWTEPRCRRGGTGGDGPKRVMVMVDLGIDSE